MNENAPKVGQLTDSSAKRDAIHVPIAPVLAGEVLLRGQRIWVDEGIAYAADENKMVAVVDPLLEVDQVERGQWFYAWLPPGSVSGLRHEWNHDSFEPSIAEDIEDEDIDYSGCGRGCG